MCSAKEINLNKYNKLRHFAKYLGKSFSMQNNLPKSFSSVQKRCLIVNYNFMIVIPEQK